MLAGAAGLVAAMVVLVTHADQPRFHGLSTLRGRVVAVLDGDTAPVPPWAFRAAKKASLRRLDGRD